MRWVAVLVVAAACGHLRFEDVIDATDQSTVDASGCVAPAGDWQLEQVNSGSNTASTIGVTMTSTTAGDLLVVAVQGEAPGIATAVTDDAGTTYTLISGTSSVEATNADELELWYAPAVTAGATTINVTYSTNALAIVAWEFRTPRAAIVDGEGELSNQATTTTPVSPSITTRCAGEIVIAISATFQINAIEPGEFTEDSGANTNGWAHLTDPHAPAGMHVATWTADSDGFCSSAAAFIVE